MRKHHFVMFNSEKYHFYFTDISLYFTGKNVINLDVTQYKS